MIVAIGLQYLVVLSGLSLNFKSEVMPPVPKSLTDTITLNDGNKMPMFGLGTYLSKEGEVEKACLEAIKLGYRHIDTAMVYENEGGVGVAVRNCGLDRKEIFVTSKLHPKRHGASEAREAVELSLKTLDIGYVDLYLIHTPVFSGKILETYDVLLEYQKKGLIKSVGVSNFGVIHLKGLAEAGRQTPAVNQLELHCFWRLEEVVKYCQDHGIVVEGYSPMAKAKKNGDPTVARIAKRLGKSPFQVMIRWSVQKGYITIPKSTKPDRIKENADVFDWSLTDEEMAELDSKPESTCVSMELMGNEWTP